MAGVVSWCGCWTWFFESMPLRCLIMTVIKLFIVTKQYNLLLAKCQQCYAVGKIISCRSVSQVCICGLTSWRYMINSAHQLLCHCTAKPHRTSQTTASLSLTADAAVCARLTPMPLLSHKLTLGSETGVFRWQVRKYRTVFMLHCNILMLNSGSSNDF